MKFLKSSLLASLFFSTPAFSQGIDYHAHIQSPEMGKAMSKICGTLSPCKPEDLEKGSNIEHLLPTLNSSQFNHAVLMSVGYMASMPELELDLETQKKLTRFENTFTAEEADKSDKITSFFSVNPLVDFSLEEARYWVEHGGHKGLKLHLANSDVDLFNPDHVKKLQDLIDVVDRAGMTIMVHYRTRNPKYGRAEIEVLIEDILPHVKKGQIIIGHSAGWGGYDAPNQQALGALIEGFKDGRIDHSEVYIGVAATILPSLKPEEIDDFFKNFRSIDSNNWVFGSDWSPLLSPFEPVGYLELMKSKGLTNEEANKLISNKLEFLKD